MKNRVPSVSLVIPVYNEESHLAVCLDAIAAQTVKPFEVIVVDNNSTDGTVAVAERYPFVTILHEPHQGVAFARDTGFNAARGDVIGRTDGDGALAPDWVARVQEAFADPMVDGATGVVGYREVGLKRMFGLIDERIRHYLAWRITPTQELFFYGINMAIRREAWRSVRHSLCHDRWMHEDLDLAAHMSHGRRRIVFRPLMRATIVPRQAAASLREFYKYVWSGPRVYAEHGMVSQRYMYPIAIATSLLYLPIHLLYLGYDPTMQRFSLRRAFRSNLQARVSPVSDLI